MQLSSPLETSNLALATKTRYNATVLQFLLDDKGAVAVVAVGLPPYSVTEPEVRSIRMALKVRHKSAKVSVCQRPTVMSIGIASGNCFCSVIGTERRSEYAVFGQPMILAARLMQGDNASQILCDEVTQKGAVRTFEFKNLGKRKLKGFAGEVTAFCPIGKVDKWKNNIVDRIPYFGRENEISVGLIVGSRAVYR